VLLPAGVSKSAAHTVPKIMRQAEWDKWEADLSATMKRHKLNLDFCSAYKIVSDQPYTGQPITRTVQLPDKFVSNNKVNSFGPVL
jgi:hypothetical protein